MQIGIRAVIGALHDILVAIVQVEGGDAGQHEAVLAVGAVGLLHRVLIACRCIGRIVGTGLIAVAVLCPVVYSGSQTLNVDIVEIEDTAVIRLVVSIGIKGEFGIVGRGHYKLRCVSAFARTCIDGREHHVAHLGQRSGACGDAACQIGISHHQQTVFIIGTQWCCKLFVTCGIEHFVGVARRVFGGVAVVAGIVYGCCVGIISRGIDTRCSVRRILIEDERHAFHLVFAGVYTLLTTVAILTTIGQTACGEILACSHRDCDIDILVRVANYLLLVIVVA